MAPNDTHKPLTNVRCQNAAPADKPYRLTDRGDGLTLEIRPNGSKLWRLRYRLAGKANMFAIGAYPTVSLQDARRATDAARDLIAQGINPALHRKASVRAKIAEGENTFEAVAEDWKAKNAPDWSPRYAAQIERFLRKDIVPSVGRFPIKDVGTRQVKDAVLKVASRSPTTAVAVRQTISAIFDFAIEEDRATQNPTDRLRRRKGAKPLIPLPETKSSRHLSIEEIQGMLTALASYGGSPLTVIAMKLKLLTFTRTEELVAAEWDEINFETAEWVLSEHRMKMRRTHLVPLARQSVELLRELHSHTGSGRFLFPNIKSAQKHMSISTLNAALKRMNVKGFSAHGFRSTASTILNERNYRSDVIEMQLAHVEMNKVRKAYNHAQYLEERKAMMQDYADLISNQSTKI
ncbi:integrase [Sulfitobacter undariae]|uniref:Integrase n=1 Tax=Sulfitobacter undariae TaxID=1563671 RepID=A0A7W6GZP8_9RHOB|nr:integrase arm-type DNA-binding domain-containing protein [Sulfitobacter undariae]MBB3993770.1 integrase [Sulfitobacter undariae]